jgi:RNA polymerase sigma-70 factor (ECF subfamily)
MDDGIGERFRTGGEAELEEIVGLYGEKLLRYAVSILCDRMDAEDVVQRAFLSAYDSRRGFDGGNVSAWLYRITYNLCMNHLKKRRFLFFADVKGHRAMAAETADPFGDGQTDDGFLKVLAKLNPKDRALLYNRVVDGYTYEDLSAILNKSPAALRKQYERAKKRVIELMEKERGNQNG